MRKFLFFLLLLAFLSVSCGKQTNILKKGEAEELLQDVLSHFQLAEGTIYSTGLLSENPLTDALLARMFPEQGDTDDLYCVRSAAVYFSKRFSDGEILVFELYDISNRDKITALFQKRAKKKENAVVLSDGVYIYWICTDRNGEISRYLKP